MNPIEHDFDRLLGVMTGMSVALIGLVLFSVRRAHIRVEYSVSWLVAGVVLLLLSLSRSLLRELAALMGISYPPLALLLVVLSVFLLVFYRFSVIISDLKDANIALTQKVAVLDYQIQTLYEGHETAAPK